MADKPTFRSYYFFVATSFIALFIGFCGGLDAWLFWVVKLGIRGHYPSILTVEAGHTVIAKNNSQHFIVQGRINQTTVEGLLIDAMPKNHDDNLPQPYSLDKVPVYWNGYAKGWNVQNRSTNLIEAEFIKSPPNRVFWGPLASLLGLLLGLEAIRSTNRPKIRIHLPFLCDFKF